MEACHIKFEFKTKENEQIEAVVRMPEEKRSIIHGIVMDCHDKVIKDAVVKLYEIVSGDCSCKLKPITHTFTDECGQFLFGPLKPHKKYAIKIWHDNVKITELVVNPKEDHDCCQNDDCHHHNYHHHDYCKNETLQDDYNSPDCKKEANSDIAKKHHISKDLHRQIPDEEE